MEARKWDGNRGKERTGKSRGRGRTPGKVWEQVDAYEFTKKREGRQNPAKGNYQAPLRCVDRHGVDWGAHVHPTFARGCF